MKKLLCCIAFSLLAYMAHGQNCTPPAGGFSINNRPPVGCHFYAGSLWYQLLPGAGSGGPLTHLAPSSDSIAQATVTAAGIMAVASTGNDGTLMNPIYYGRATDPIYVLNSCPSASAAPYNPLNTFWHIPNQAAMSGGQSDQFLTVWDQTNNKVMSLYKGSSGLGTAAPPNKLASCSATTTGTACAMTGTMAVSFCSMDNFTDGAGYRVGNGAGDTLAEAPAALVIRADEWISGIIPHAIYLNVVNNASGKPSVFPAGGSTGRTAAGTWPQEGNLYFFDYTDAQINAMNLKPYQKAIVLVMSHYGGYIGDTGATSGINPSRTEAGEAYTQAGLTNPLFAWLSGPLNGLSSHVDGTSQQVFNLNIWAGIPLVNGLDVAHHAHIADPCIALGLAGQAGGCATVIPPTNPILAVAPNPGPFGSVNLGSTSALVTFTITNSGTGSLVLANPAFALSGTNPGDFTLSSTTCTGNLTITTGSCTIKYTATPSAVGSRTATLTVSSNGGNIAIPLSVTGIGTPDASLTSLNGGVPRSVNNIDDAGDWGTLSCPEPIPLPNPIDGSWTYKHDTGTAGTSCGNSSLAASPAQDGQSRRFDFSWTGFGGERASIFFNPTALDSISRTFVIDLYAYFTSLANVNQLEIDMNQVMPNGKTQIQGIQCNFNAGFWQYTTLNPATSSTQWVSSTIPCLRGNFNTSTTANHIILTSHRDGSGVATYDSVNLNGVTTAFTSATGNSAFTLGWTPIGANVLNFQINGDNTASSMSAYIDEVSVFSSGASLGFGTQAVNTTSAPLTAVLLNSGTAPLTIASFTTAAPFAISANACPVSPATLAVGNTCQISVTASPTTGVTSNGVLTVTSNASSGAQAIPLAVTGQVPAVTGTGVIISGGITINGGVAFNPQ